MNRIANRSVANAVIQWWTDRLFPPSSRHQANRHDERDAAVRFTRGNIAIQSGQFITTEDLEWQRKQVSSLKFPQ